MSKKKVKKNNHRPKGVGAGDDQDKDNDHNKDLMNSCCIPAGEVLIYLSFVPQFNFKCLMPGPQFYY